MTLDLVINLAAKSAMLIERGPNDITATLQDILCEKDWQALVGSDSTDALRSYLDSIEIVLEGV